MVFKNHKFLLFVIFFLINSVNLYDLNNNGFKRNLRRIWEEKVQFNDDSVTGNNSKSIDKYCKKSGYKYFSHFVYGNFYEFTGQTNEGNAVSIKYYYINIYKGSTNKLAK